MGPLVVVGPISIVDGICSHVLGEPTREDIICDERGLCAWVYF